MAFLSASAPATLLNQLSQLFNCKNGQFNCADFIVMCNIVKEMIIKNRKSNEIKACTLISNEPFTLISWSYKMAISLIDLFRCQLRLFAVVETFNGAKYRASNSFNGSIGRITVHDSSESVKCFFFFQLFLFAFVHLFMIMTM